MNSAAATLGSLARWLRRSPRARWVLTATAAVGVISALVLLLQDRPEPVLPEGKGADTPQEKKAAFINYLVPYVREVNTGILSERRRLLSIREDIARGGQPGFFDARWLKKIVVDYESAPPVKVDVSFLDQMLVRVDAVPPSLVVAQAAVESAWGTSRFARHGNNLFGMRAYDGTGVVPKGRERGEKFMVATYESVRESIADYIHNLNTGESYIDLRMTRRELRQRGQPLTGASLAPGLAGYSGRGPNYAETIRAVIQNNKLGRFD